MTYRLSVHTSLAIDKFIEIERAKHRIEKKERELTVMMSRIPNEDMPEYVRITESFIAHIEHQDVPIRLW